MKIIAAAAVAGIDPMRWLQAESDIEIRYLQLVAEQAIELQSKHRQDLANRIVTNIAILFGVKVKASG